ncbi:MAG TPA: ABC transporter permease [Bryobacteraceae bacterium]
MNRWLVDAWQDFRFAKRLFHRQPGFTSLVALTLGLGVGATTAVYTIVRAVLLRSPYRDAGRIVAIWDNAARDGDQVRQILASGADFAEYKRSARLLDDIGIAGRTRPVLHYGDTNQTRMAGLVTASLFRSTLGVEAQLGRTFVPEDEQGGCSVVLAHSFWVTVLGGQKSWVGRSLSLDQSSCTVLGVMPAGFTLFPNTADMWFLVGHAPSTTPNPPFGMVCARLKPGVTIDQARAEIAALHAAVNSEHTVGGDPEPGLTPAVEYIRQELTTLTGPTLRTSLLLSFGAVSLLLLIACLNVASLLLARLADRQRELTVRSALGSGRMRLIRQVLTEGLALAVIGMVLGVGFAIAGVSLFRYLNPVELPPHAGEISVDIPVLLFAVLLAVGTTLSFGLLPAFEASRTNLDQSLRTLRGVLGVVSGYRTARLLITAQITVSFILLIGAGLLMSSALHLSSESLGFRPEGVIALDVTLPAARYSKADQRSAFQQALLGRLERLRGVESVALGWAPPWDPHQNWFEEIVEVRGLAGQSDVNDVQSASAGSGLFGVLGTPLLRGRSFVHEDGAGGPPVAIVSQRLVDEYFAGRDPLGQQIRYGFRDHLSEWVTVVGVVTSWKHMVADAAWRDTPMVFRPFVAGAPNFQVSIRMRSGAPSRELEIQRQVVELDSAAQAKADVLSDRVSKMLLFPRFRAGLLVGFGLAALLLAAVGLHGLLSQLVARRSSEFGVRRAVGAQTRDLVFLVARQGGTPVLVGIILGLGAAAALTRVLQNMLYGVRAADPAVLLLAILVLLSAAVLGMAFPARRAAQVDPMTVLREE